MSWPARSPANSPKSMVDAANRPWRKWTFFWTSRSVRQLSFIWRLKGCASILFFTPLLYPKGEHRICHGVRDEHVVEGDVERVEELIYFCIPSEGVMRHKKFRLAATAWALSSGRTIWQTSNDARGGRRRRPWRYRHSRLGGTEGFPLRR